jgi:hypothetical protein
MLEQLHGGGVSEHVRGHALAPKRRATGSRDDDVLGQQMLDSVAAQGFTA